MIGAKCEGCGTRIRKGEERVALAAFVVAYKNEEELGYVAHADIRRVFHYCKSCGIAEEVRVCNPWMVHWTPEQIRWMEECEAEARAESVAESEHLARSLLLATCTNSIAPCPLRRSEMI